MISFIKFGRVLRFHGMEVVEGLEGVPVHVCVVLGPSFPVVDKPLDLFLRSSFSPMHFQKSVFFKFPYPREGQRSRRNENVYRTAVKRPAENRLLLKGTIRDVNKRACWVHNFKARLQFDISKVFFCLTKTCYERKRILVDSERLRGLTSLKHYCRNQQFATNSEEVAFLKHCG